MARAAGGLSAGLVAMMAVAMFINYADRGSLSVAAPVLTDQLKISSSQMGLLLSAFFWSFAAARMAAARGCSLAFSRLAMACSSWASSMPSAAMLTGGRSGAPGFGGG